MVTFAQGNFVVPIGVRYYVVLFSQLIATSHAAYKMVCYYESWAVYRRMDSRLGADFTINPPPCTHLIYAFGILKDGEITSFDPQVDLDGTGQYGGYQKFNQINVSLVKNWIWGYPHVTRAVKRWGDKKPNQNLLISDSLRSCNLRSGDALHKENKFVLVTPKGRNLQYSKCESRVWEFCGALASWALNHSLTSSDLAACRRLTGRRSRTFSVRLHSRTTGIYKYDLINQNCINRTNPKDHVYWQQNGSWSLCCRCAAVLRKLAPYLLTSWLKFGSRLRLKFYVAEIAKVSWKFTRKSESSITAAKMQVTRQTRSWDVEFKTRVR